MYSIGYVELYFEYVRKSTAICVTFLLRISTKLLNLILSAFYEIILIEFSL